MKADTLTNFIFDAITSFRWIFGAHAFITSSVDSSRTMLLKALFDGLPRVIKDSGIKIEDLARLLSYLPHYLRYCARQSHWLVNLAEALDTDRGLVAGHQDFTSANLTIEDYVLGLFEENCLVMWDTNVLNRLLGGRRILDFGCGGGFLYALCRQLGDPILDYVGYDRPEVLAVARQLWGAAPETAPAFTSHLDPNDRFHVVWLANVLHSHGDTFCQLLGEAALHASERIYIIEPHPGAAWTDMLGLQLRAHHKDACLLSPMALTTKILDEYNPQAEEMLIPGDIHPVSDTCFAMEVRKGKHA